MPAQNLLNRRGRRKHPLVRFGGGVGAANPHPPSPEQQHASHQQPPQRIEENPRTESDTETDESGTDPEEFDEYISVSLADLRSNVQCPICLGIIKKLADHLANLQKDQHQHVFPVITSGLQNEATLWLRDYRTTNSDNASILMDDLKPLILIVKRWCDDLSIENLLFKVHSIAKR